MGSCAVLQLQLCFLHPRVLESRTDSSIQDVLTVLNLAKLSKQAITCICACIRIGVQAKFLKIHGVKKVFRLAIHACMENCGCSDYAGIIFDHDRHIMLT